MLLQEKSNKIVISSSAYFYYETDESVLIPYTLRVNGSSGNTFDTFVKAYYANSSILPND